MGKTYDVFISYSHRADARLAKCLEGGLKDLNRKWNERRALEVFRDESSLSASPHLWSTLATQLESSRFGIVLLSPGAAQSAWVWRETDHFLSTHGEDRLLLALTEGELAWDSEANDWTVESTAVPAGLRGRLTAEPLWVDFRWAKGETDLSLRDTRFRAAVATLAAPVHGMSLDELEGEDVRAHRKFVRIRRAAVSGLFALLVLSLAASVVALVARRQTATERGLRQQLTVANDRLSSTNKALDDRNKQLDVANEKLTSTNAQLDLVNKQLNAVNDDLKTANAQLGDSNKKLDSLNIELEAKNGELGLLNSELATSNTKLDTANKSLDVTNKELATANQRLVELEAFAAKAAGAAICSRASVRYQVLEAESQRQQLAVQWSKVGDGYDQILRALARPDATTAEVRVLAVSLSGDFQADVLGTPPVSAPPGLGSTCSTTKGYPFRDSWSQIGDPGMDPYTATFMPNCEELLGYSGCPGA